MGQYDVGDQVTVKARFGINVTTVKDKASAGDTTITLYSVTGYTGTDSLILNPGEDTEETRVIASISGLTVTLTAALSHDHWPGEIVAELADPTTVSLKHKKPDGTITEYTFAAGTVTRDSLGVFSKNLSLADEGSHAYRFAGTGTVETAEEARFSVRESAF